MARCRKGQGTKALRFTEHPGSWCGWSRAREVHRGGSGNPEGVAAGVGLLSGLMDHYAGLVQLVMGALGTEVTRLDRLQWLWGIVWMITGRQGSGEGGRRPVRIHLRDRRFEMTVAWVRRMAVRVAGGAQVGRAPL